MNTDLSRYYELNLPVITTPKRRTAGIDWTAEMIDTITSKFATSFNRDLAGELGVSLRTLIRKARELGLEKEPGFLEKNRKTISKMAKDALLEVKTYRIISGRDRRGEEICEDIEATRYSHHSHDHYGFIRFFNWEFTNVTKTQNQ